MSYTSGVARFLDSELLRRVRVELGLTQDQAAARLGIDARSYRRYESGAVNDPVHGFVVRHAKRGRVTDRICAEFGIDEALLLRDRAPARGGHVLPGARHFVGRAALLDELTTWRDAAAPPERVVALVALGGAGKTSLLERVIADTTADGITFAWSFYEDARAEGFLRELARALGATDATLDRVLEALGEGTRHLLGLDGLEAIQSDGRGGRARGELADAAVKRLLRTLAAGLGEARALVTSRFELADLASWQGRGARTIALGPLASDESLALLARWGVRGNAQTLAASLGGHALSLAVAGSYASAFLDGDATRLDHLSLDEAAGDDPLARRLAQVVAEYARALAPVERDLLARLAAFPSGATMETLFALAQAPAVAGALAGVDGERLRHAAKRLARLGLISSGERALVHPFLRERFVRLLDVKPEALHAIERSRLEEALHARPAIPHDPAFLDRAEALFHATLAAGAATEAFALYARTLGGFAHLGLTAGDMLRGARVLGAFAPDGDPARLDARLAPELRARVAYDLGLYAGALGDLAHAERCYQAFEAHARNGTAGPALVALRTRAYVARLRGELHRALAFIETSVALASAREYRDNLGRALALEASIRHDLGQTRAARELFRRASEEGPLEARRALWESEHAAALGETHRAREIAARVAAASDDVGWAGHAAHAHAVLGNLALPNAGLASDHAARARAWSDASGEVEMRLRVRLLDGRIALARNARDRAESIAADGIALADGCGFVLAGVRLRLLAAAATRSRSLCDEALATATACGDAWGAADARSLRDGLPC